MRVETDAFMVHFAALEDPRTHVHNRLHQPEDILLLTILAVVSEAETWDEVEEFGHAKWDRL